jgi:hypothetical protein
MILSVPKGKLWLKKKWSVSWLREEMVHLKLLNKIYQDRDECWNSERATIQKVLDLVTIH